MLDYRTEQKFFVRKEVALDLQKYLESHAVFDPNCATQSNKLYEVYTLYFDTPQRKLYWEKVNGDSVRSKFRIRYYENDLSSYHYEIKHKRGRFGFKERHQISIENGSVDERMEAFYLDRKIIPLELKGENQFYQYISRYDLSPNVWTRYQRLAFIDPRSSSNRITFDLNISAAKFMGQASRSTFYPVELETSQQNRVLIEVKFGATVPTWFSDFLNMVWPMRSSLSKYIAAVDTMDSPKILLQQQRRSNGILL